MPNIYGYIDYRRYLMDYIKEKKVNNPRFSCRLFSSRMGICAATLARILNGERNISKKLLPVFIAELNLREKSAEYFSLMVQLTVVKNPENKNVIFQKMLDLRSERMRKVNPIHYSLFEKWYLIALREVIDIRGKIDNVSSVSESLRPSIPVKEAENAIKTLKNLNIIYEDNEGCFHATEKLLTTGEKWEHVAIQKYQSEMIGLANHALMSYPKHERDISTVTVGLSVDDLLKVKEILRRTRQEILAIAEDSKRRDYVYQLNMQLFPVSNCLREAGNNDQ